MRKSEINKTPKVLMVGPGRQVMGGISTVVNSYYDLGLGEKVELKYIASMEDGNKIKKLLVAGLAYMRYCHSLKKFDIVHIHMAAQASFNRKSIFVKKAKKAGKRIIIHQHAADFDDFFFHQSNDDKRKKIKKIFSMADCIIVLSEEWESFFAENICDKNKIIVLHNGVIIPEYKKNDYNDKNVLFLGRLGKRKGSYDLLKAIPAVVKQVPEAMFYLGGDGDIEQSQKIIEKQGLSEHVKLLGWVRDSKKEKYLKQCSTFILPSYHEGMPMSVLEAMSYGLATISTNVGGIPQIIDHGVDGYLVGAGDVGEITKVLIDLLINRKLKIKLGQAGRKKIITKLNAKTCVDKLVSIYRNLC